MPHPGLSPGGVLGPADPAWRQSPHTRRGPSPQRVLLPSGWAPSLPGHLRLLVLEKLSQGRDEHLAATCPGWDEAEEAAGHHSASCGLGC